MFYHFVMYYDPTFGTDNPFSMYISPVFLAGTRPGKQWSMKGMEAGVAQTGGSHVIIRRERSTCPMPVSRLRREGPKAPAPHRRLSPPALACCRLPRKIGAFCSTGLSRREHLLHTDNQKNNESCCFFGFLRSSNTERPSRLGEMACSWRMARSKSAVGSYCSSTVQRQAGEAGTFHCLLKS
jgi:hypothetical protein